MKKGVLKFFFIAFVLMAILTPLVLFQGQGGFANFANVANAENPAKTGLDKTAGDLGLSKAGDGDPISITANIVKFILGFLGLVFILLLMYGGFIRMTAQGSPEKIKSSTGIITSAIIGVFIILAAYGITVFVVGEIGRQVETIGNACVYTCTTLEICNASNKENLGQKDNCVSPNNVCCKLMVTP